MSEHDFIKWRMITGKLKGALSKEEERAFQAWYKADARHQAYFKRVQEQWEKEEEDGISVDVEAFIQDFDRHTLKHQAKRPATTHHRWIWVAAVMFPLLLVGAMYLLTNRQMPETNLPGIAKLEPGESKAKLTLADGRAIYLDRHAKTINTIISNGILLQQDSGVLAYWEMDRNKQTTQDMNKIEVPRGGEYVLALSDGTKVWLNSGTKLVYPVCFTGDERQVQLDGEAYFEVKHNPDFPFIVKTKNNAVKVYGTSFNVSAYTEDKNTVTTLQEGNVGVFVQGQEYRLKPGEQAIVEGNSDIVEVKKVNANTYCSWHKGTFIFEEETLDEILIRLARWYNVQIFYQNPSIKKLHFTGDLGRYEDFNEVLKLIELTTNVEFVVQDRNITVKYK